MRKIIQDLDFFIFKNIYSKVVETNLKAKESVVERKLAAMKSFEKFCYVRVPPIPQLIYTSLA